MVSHAIQHECVKHHIQILAYIQLSNLTIGSMRDSMSVFNITVKMDVCVLFWGGGGGGGGEAFSTCHQHNYECICADLVSTHLCVTFNCYRKSEF